MADALQTSEAEIVARLRSGRLLVCEGQGDPSSDGCGGQGYTGAAGQEPCEHCFGAGVMTPELRRALDTSSPAKTAQDEEDDREIDRILALSGDEVRAELIADGHDPDALVRQQRSGLDGLLRLAGDRERWRSEAASWRRVAERLEEEKAALAAQSPPSRGDGTAEGWVMVPREPSEAMVAAAQAECHRMAGVIDPVMHVWDAFLAAAPAAPSATDGEDAERRIAYAEQRRDFYINEAQRLALLVRKLGGDPELSVAAAQGSDPARLTPGALANALKSYASADGTWFSFGLSDLSAVARELCAPSATDGETEAEKPCHWGGGNDVIWCSTCGEEYAYAKGESRPACPREVPATDAGGGDGGLAGLSEEMLRETLFAFLCRKYVQRADARQKSMGLQYTEAETHDLAEEVARFTAALLPAAHRQTVVGDGWQLVPKHPLPEMLAAWWRTKNTGTTEIGGEHQDSSDVAAYRAMLSAAPKWEGDR